MAEPTPHCLGNHLSPSRSVPEGPEPSSTGPGLLLPLPTPAAPRPSRRGHSRRLSLQYHGSQDPLLGPVCSTGRGEQHCPSDPPSQAAERRGLPAPPPVTAACRSRPRAPPPSDQNALSGTQPDWPAGQSLRRAPSGEAGPQPPLPGSGAFCRRGCVRAREGGAWSGARPGR